MIVFSKFTMTRKILAQLDMIASNRIMRTRTAFLVIAALLAAFAFSSQTSAQADTFGSGSNVFTLDFVNIGNAGNAADTTGYGAVPYEYRIGKYEISQDAIDKATASGMANVTAGAWSGNQPTANINWYEAAAFVNWLNFIKGYQTAYDLTYDEDSGWTMQLWTADQSWQLGGENLYRHKDAYYFLPNENEWYKAAYHKNDGVSGNYWLYPTASDVAPIAVVSGSETGTAVYGGLPEQPANIFAAGGLSAYGTMAQGGNVFEWTESAYSGSNADSSAPRSVRGDDYDLDGSALVSTERGSVMPSSEQPYIGFRVATVPEPSTYALLLMTGAGALWLARRKR